MDSFDMSTPQGIIAYYTALSGTPQGQAAIKAQGQTAQMNVKIANAQMQAQKQQIAIQQGEAKANAWYQQQQVKIAQQAHELAVQTQQQNFGLAQGALTGVYEGQPTLQAQNQQQQYAIQQAQLALAQLTQQQQHEIAQGTLDLATLTQQQQNAIQQAQLGLQQAGLTGTFDGKPTLAAIAQQQQFQIAQGNLAVSQAGVSGYLPNGAPTLGREQAAANTSLQAGQLAASLQGPGNWARFLQAQNGMAGSPASALVASAPGGLGASAGLNPAPLTLASVLGDWGVAPQQGGGGGTPGANQATPNGALMTAALDSLDPSGSQRQSFTAEYQRLRQAGTDDATALQQAYGAVGGNWGNLQASFQQPGGSHATDQQGRYAGGSSLFNEQTGQYDGSNPYAGFWNTSSPTGAIGQVMNAPRVTNAQLGLSDDEAKQLQGYFDNPNSAPAGWYESKSPDQRAYLQGINSYWGGSPDTFAYRYKNSRPNQGAYNMAA